MRISCENCSGPCWEPRVEIFKNLYMANMTKILCMQNEYFMWQPKDQLEKELFEI
jgi:hypothetical protein